MKVLIVEDERRAARAIGRMVNQHPSFSVAGMATNGEEALTFLRETPVDLVITDIRMPVMGGIQLMEILQREFPSCLYVVLSGYSNFDYAKAALQYHAFDYLLKPISQNELFLMLDKVAFHLSGQSQTQQHALIRQALAGDVSANDNGLRFHMALVSAGQPENASAQGSFWNDPEQAAWLRQCFTTDDIVFSSTPGDERIFILDASQPVKEQLELYFRQAALHCQGPVNIIYTQRAVTLGDLSAVAKKLRLALSLRRQLFQSNIFAVDHLQPLPASAGTSLREMRPDRAVEAICTQNRLKLTEALEDMLQVAEEYGTLLTDVENYLASIVSDARIAYQTPPAVLSQTKAELLDILSHATDPKQCVKDLTKLLLSLQSEPAGKRNMADVVDEIVQQIENNYHLPLSAETFANQYSLTPSYLNKVFKQYKGMRPSEYLLNLRMDRARQMLETMPDALVKDVANSVGYADPYYFSKVFKRATGLWPTECQKQQK